MAGWNLRPSDAQEGRAVARGEVLRVVLLAAASSVVVVALALAHAHQSGMGWVALVQPGPEGAAVEVFDADFPDVQLQPGIGHDGQYFYAVARAPTDLDALSTQLGRPRYRLQRPLFPALAWVLHPTGGGYGLVAALIAVGVASLLLLGVSAGLLSLQLGGPPLVAAVIPAIPGSLWAFRLGLADNLALGLTIACFVALHLRRTGVAVAAATGAVLAKEAMLVIIVANALAARDRPSTIAAAVATVVVGAWWALLRLFVEASGPQVAEFGRPFGGVIDNLEVWANGEHLLAAGTLISALVLLVLLVVFRRGRALLWPVVAWMAFGSFLGRDVLGLDHNGARTMAPAVVLAVIALVTPAQRSSDDRMIEDARQETTTP